MKKVTIIAVAMICLLTIGQTAYSQATGSSYKTAVGAKVYFGNGTLGGVNIKHFLKNNSALEGSLLFDNGYVGIEGLYDWHGDIANAQGLRWYVGGGGMVLFPTKDYLDTWFALRGTLGLDYKFTGAPINVSFDVNPTFQLAPNTDFHFWGGFAFRFAF